MEKRKLENKKNSENLEKAETNFINLYLLKLCLTRKIRRKNKKICIKKKTEMEKEEKEKEEEQREEANENYRRKKEK